MALVIGNGAYRWVEDSVDSVVDADAVTQAFEGAGFDVEKHIDLSLYDLLIALRSFQRASRDAEIAVVYYAGYGITVDGKNYLIPGTASLQSDLEVLFETVPLDRAVAAVDGADRLGVVLLDASRPNPFVQRLLDRSPTREITEGMAAVEVFGNTVVLLPAAEMTPSLPGTAETPGPLAAGIVALLENPETDLSEVLTRLPEEVASATSGAQVPVLFGTPRGPRGEPVPVAIVEPPVQAPQAEQPAPAPQDPVAATLRPEPAPVTTATRQTEPTRRQPDAEVPLWISILGSENPDDYKRYLDAYPSGVFAATAQRMFESLGGSSTSIGPAQGGSPSISDNVSQLARNGLPSIGAAVRLGGGPSTGTSLSGGSPSLESASLETAPELRSEPALGPAPSIESDAPGRPSLVPGMTGEGADSLPEGGTDLALERPRNPGILAIEITPLDTTLANVTAQPELPPIADVPSLQVPGAVENQIEVVGAENPPSLPSDQPAPETFIVAALPPEPSANPLAPVVPDLAARPDWPLGTDDSDAAPQVAEPENGEALPEVDFTVPNRLGEGPDTFMVTDATRAPDPTLLDRTTARPTPLARDPSATRAAPDTPLQVPEFALAPQVTEPSPLPNPDPFLLIARPDESQTQTDQLAGAPFPRLAPPETPRSAEPSPSAIAPDQTPEADTEPGAQFAEVDVVPFDPPVPTAQLNIGAPQSPRAETGLGIAPGNAGDSFLLTGLRPRTVQQAEPAPLTPRARTLPYPKPVAEPAPEETAPEPQIAAQPEPEESPLQAALPPATPAEPAPEPEPQETAQLPEPEPEPFVLNRDTVRQVQNQLNALGFNTGFPDGIPGRRTANGVARFQRDAGLQVTGLIDEETARTITSRISLDRAVLYSEVDLRFRARARNQSEPAGTYCLENADGSLADGFDGREMICHYVRRLSRQVYEVRSYYSHLRDPSGQRIIPIVTQFRRTVDGRFADAFGSVFSIEGERIFMEGEAFRASTGPV